MLKRAKSDLASGSADGKRVLALLTKAAAGQPSKRTWRRLIIVVQVGVGHDVSHWRVMPTLQAVSQHPSTVAVCCGPFIEAWRNYTGGIFDIAGACAHPCYVAR